MSANPRIIHGGKYIDERGELFFFNNLDMDAVRRFYTIKHRSTSIIRAWQGHRHEEKWFHVQVGAFKIVVVKPDDWKRPSNEGDKFFFYLSAKEPEVLHIPQSYVTGFCALEKNSIMNVYSNATVEESQKDDYRFEVTTWPVNW
jgi:dTDP-4-dehydrorhamnose 3,5-epimerase